MKKNISDVQLLRIAFLLFFFSSSVYLINFFFFKFPGNNYFPASTLSIFLFALLNYMGCSLISEYREYLMGIAKNFFMLISIYALIAFATNAVQYTPFTPIDKYIIAFEDLFGFSMPDVLNWTYSHPLIFTILAVAYDSITYQLAFIPLIVLLTGEYLLIRRFFFMLLITATIGFPFYYFFPSTGPASNIESPFFMTAQYATGIKFQELHHYIQPSTIEGGMIALPSFHMIWAWLCVYLLKPWPLAWTILAVNNILLSLACVMLGWHYPLDLIFSTVILCFAFYCINNTSD